VRWHTFDVYGEPVPQGSKRAIVHRTTQKPVVIESAGARLKSWRQAVVDEARRALHDAPPLEGPVTVFITFFLRMPKRPRHALPITRPDADKLARSCLDALQAAGMFRDDAQVTSLTVKKRYVGTTDPPRAYIAIGEEG
jgi:crossover junction endodeoxyribonuclease RusA